MKLLSFGLVFIVLILSVMTASAQQDTLNKRKGSTSVKPPENSRISVKQPVGNQYKPAVDSVARRQDSLRIVALNEPIQGGILSIGGILGIPVGEFADHTNGKVGYGFDITFLANLASKRTRKEWEERFINYYAGGYFQFMRQSGTSDSYDYTDGYFTTTVDSKVKNNITSFGVLSRIEFLPGKVKLFVEAGAGFRVFNGVHQVSVENKPNNSTNPDDIRTVETRKGLGSTWVGNYGFGGGIRFGGESMGIELKFTSVKGTTAEYVDIESVRFERSNNKITYSTLQSTTDLFIPQISISGRF